MYFKKCWQGVLYQKGKFNYRAYNYVRNVIIDYFGMSDLYKIYKCLEKARKYAEEENAKAEKAKVQELNPKAYSDLLGDLL